MHMYLQNCILFGECLHMLLKSLQWYHFFVTHCMCKDTADSLLVIATGAVVDRFGWTMFSATVAKPVSRIVVTWAGAVTTARTITTSQFLVSQVCVTNSLLFKPPGQIRTRENLATVVRVEHLTSRDTVAYRRGSMGGRGFNPHWPVQ